MPQPSGLPAAGRVLFGARFLRAGAAALFGLAFGTCAARAEDLAPKAATARAALHALMSEKAVWKGPETAPKPVAGKRVAVVACCNAAEGSSRPANAIADAGRLLGWTVDILDGKGDPAEQSRAVNAAIDAKYDAIALDFVDTPVVADSLKRAMDANIPLITLGTIKNTPETIPDVSHDYVATGVAIANYMVWKSNGHIDALLLKNTDLYEIEYGQYLGTNSVLSDPAKCDDCKLQVKDWTFAQIDTQPAALASAAIQANPALNWVWCFDACMSRTARSLKAAGLDANIRGAGFDCNGENNQLIKDGVVQVVCACDPREWEGYAVIDNLNRMFQGQPAVAQNIPIRLFDKDNIGELTPYELQHGWQGDYDFRSKYKKLWGLM